MDEIEKQMQMCSICHNLCAHLSVADLEQIDALLSVLDSEGLAAHVDEQALQQLAVGRGVLHDQHARPRQRLRQRARAVIVAVVVAAGASRPAQG